VIAGDRRFVITYYGFRIVMRLVFRFGVWFFSGWFCFALFLRYREEIMIKLEGKKKETFWTFYPK